MARTAEFVLGLIGGILGLISVPVIFFLGFVAGFLYKTSIMNMAMVAGLLSIVGIIGAAIVKEKPKLGGIMMLISGVLGFFTALGLFLGAILLGIAGLIALLRKEKRRIKKERIKKKDLPLLAKIGWALLILGCIIGTILGSALAFIILSISFFGLFFYKKGRMSEREKKIYTLIAAVDLLLLFLYFIGWLYG